ncbi:MAG: RNB domain-containing ribonuclease [Actinobacteria bacterium]|nr:RNB domain-containing ribonuclease [Actinomycetota bacterium]
MLIPKGRALVARRIFDRGASIQLKQDRKRGAGNELRPGELVIVEPAGIQRAKQHGRMVTQPVGKVVRRLGSPDVTRDVLEALMIERGLRRTFPGTVEHHAQAAATGEDLFTRRDLTDLATFTMDPEGAKDYDDAISAEADGDRIRVWVHIADVTSFVRPGDPVDKEAYRRATSVYVPGAVEPMLPEALSNQACSLVPGEPRRAVSVEMLFGADGMESAAFHRTTIRSDARLTYGQVDEIFAGAARAQDPWAGPLDLARKIGRSLQELRERRQALEVESSEPVFDFDRAGEATEVHAETQTESHKVIEHLMIAANEAVARYLSDHHLPTLYRVHERPEPERVNALVDQLVALGVATPPLPEHFTPQQAEVFVGEISAFVADHVRRTGTGRASLSPLVLRALKQAVYSPENLGHSGLRSTHYCHFTSPIRRYPDVVAHRALLAGLGLDDVAPKAKDLWEAAEWTSAGERNAAAIERKADDVSRAFVLDRLLREQGWKPPDADSQRSRRPDRGAMREHAQGGPFFAGEVSGVIGGGLFVAFGPDLEFEGMVPLRELKEARGGYWNLDDLEVKLVDENSGSEIAIGASIKVAVISVEPARGRVDLLPVSV